jgi:transcriptional regulator with XRE-family HTH domain
MHDINCLEDDRRTARRAMLRDFLRSRRARLTPGDVGLAPGGRRHTRGLRREEVAVLSGVSESWYTWLEQGRDIRVSDAVLDGISRALRLSDSERAHLYRLAGARPSMPEPPLTHDDLAHLQRVVNGWLPAPAYVIDRYWNVLSANTYATVAMGIHADDNFLTGFFTDPETRDRYPHWEEVAAQLVGRFREQVARYADDARLAMMVRGLARSDDRFAELWSRHELCDRTRTSVAIRLPGGADQTFEYAELGLLGRADLRVKLYIPVRPDAPQHTPDLTLDTDHTLAAPAPAPMPVPAPDLVASAVAVAAPAAFHLERRAG